jgi:hypothetical protein
MRVRRVKFVNWQEFANNQCLCCVYLSVATDTKNCFTATLANDFYSSELTAYLVMKQVMTVRNLVAL